MTLPLKIRHTAIKHDLVKPEGRKAAGISPEKVRRWHDDPRIFAEEVCHVRGDRWQEKFWAALGGTHLDPFAKARLALKACKGPGKTFGLAVAGWWWLFTRWHANGIVCSITADNLRDNLWAEFSRIQNNAPLLRHFFNVRGERIEAKEHPKTWWLSARSFPQNADRNQQANTLAGLHGRFPIVLLDEVGDYPDGVLVAAEAIFADKHADPRLIIAGNPTNTDGPLYRVCNRDRQYWWVHEITGDPDDPDCASRIDKAENKKLIEQWGRDNAYVLVNVFGKFPPQGSDQLIGPELWSQCAGREPDIRSYQREPTVWGLDPAGRGLNESVLFKRQGVATRTPRTWRTTDTMVLCDQVALEWERDRPTKFFVDSGGLGGPVCDRLASLGVDLVRVDGGSNAAEEDKFFDKRTEMWWQMAQWMKQGGCVPNDAKLRADLTAPNFGYKITNKKTKFRLETKDELRKRGIESPDHGDALALTFASPVYGRSNDDAFNGLPGLAHYRANQKILGGTEDGWNPLGDD